MADEGTQKHQNSVAAPLIFLIVLGFQFLSRWLKRLKKKGSKSGKENQLRKEIKQLAKEASSLSQPSTFAQAAKLRRIAATKEKELANYQNLHGKDYKLYLKILLFSRVFMCVALLFWFWSVPVASISQQLVHPFGKFLSWRTGGLQNSNVMVGIIPWLIVSSRVSKFICRRIH